MALVYADCRTFAYFLNPSSLELSKNAFEVLFDAEKKFKGGAALETYYKMYSTHFVGGAIFGAYFKGSIEVEMNSSEDKS